MWFDRALKIVVAGDSARRLTDQGMPMQIVETRLPGVFVLEPRVFTDDRGFFKETWQQQRYAEMGIRSHFVQDNISRSTRGTIRGLHYQIENAQAKLVHVLRGEVFDVAVDLRRDSPTFGRWTGCHLTESNHRQLYIPAGCAHGFCVLSETADVFYKCSDFYYPEHERTLLWDDPDIGIDWPFEGEPLLSEKDRAGTPFGQVDTFDTTPPLP